MTHEMAQGQLLGEAKAMTLPVPEPDRMPDVARPGRHCWNRLISDFVAAVRGGDVAHTSVPHLPSLEDGLRSQEVIVAARRLDQEGRWVALDESAS